MPYLIVDNQNIEVDPEGFLIHLSDWNETVAKAIAQNEGISLTTEHWEVIHFLRNFYQTYQIAPAIRIVVKFLRENLGTDKGSSLYLHSLFPAGAAKQSNRIAGLPKPTRCI